MVDLDELIARLEDNDKVLFQFSDEERRVILSSLRVAAQVVGKGPFITGISGATDQMGLPDALIVCPQFGLDGACLYKKAGDYSAPGY